jgi:hypothetical protein
MVALVATEAALAVRLVLTISALLTTWALPLEPMLRVVVEVVLLGRCLLR